MEILQHLIPVFIMAGLAAGWFGIQLLAKKMGTKNHIDDRGSCCGGDSCGSCKPSGETTL